MTIHGANGRQWAPGDKIVQTENDYNRDVFNGDLGYVVSADAEDKTVLARFEDREVLFTSDALGKLQLAYAMTGHKAQGSEFPAVVIPLVRSHWHMLERQWLYTSLTRGKRRVVLVGHPSAIKRAVNHVTGQRRLTSLPIWLRQPALSVSPTHKGRAMAKRALEVAQQNRRVPRIAASQIPPAFKAG
ncbi:hypothetical protein HSBAA_PA_0060 (plasmid) [Vreelandella sulfidaeris]|uniref:UvrD-like helicase C-terminal domain-containing protein n=1 Tax=Vreelandella sulfidaeris TaxID=115553 RepID=A0A455UJ23_9GAMM|nr:hypothetical protein HSBAA_PA_0060 [Halomonas sulfidaeris]